MGSFYQNQPVRSKYFNYTIQTSKYAFHTQLFQQFLCSLSSPSTTHHCLTARMQKTSGDY